MPALAAALADYAAGLERLVAEKNESLQATAGRGAAPSGERSQPGPQPGHPVAAPHDEAGLVARGPQPAHPRLGAGARRQPPRRAGSRSARRSCSGCCVVAVARALLRQPHAAAHDLHQLDRALGGRRSRSLFYAVLWIVLTLDTLRLVRLVKVAPVGARLRRRARGRRARGDGGRRRIRRGQRGVGDRRARHRLLGRRDRGARRGPLQHPAARRRRRARPPRDAARQHLGGQHRRRDRQRRDLRHPAQHGAGAVRRPGPRCTGRSRTATTAATTAW